MIGLKFEDKKLLIKSLNISSGCKVKQKRIKEELLVLTSFSQKSNIERVRSYSHKSKMANKKESVKYLENSSLIAYPAKPNVRFFQEDELVKKFGNNFQMRIGVDRFSQGKN